jgi:hypothetical protein
MSAVRLGQARKSLIRIGKKHAKISVRKYISGMVPVRL